jgi:hypothetical protein
MTEAAGTAGFPRLDGVILLDAVALQDLVWVTGDVSVDRRIRPLTDATTAAALEIDAFLGSLPGKASQLHANWASDVVLAFLDHRPAVESLAQAMAADARDRHLAIFLVDRSEQRLVRALGLDGGVRLGAPGVLPVAATWSGTGQDHVGAVVETSIRHTVVVREDGSASVETEVVFDNAAGTDPPSVFLGRGTGGVPVGTFAADVTLALPRKARDVVAETSEPSPIATGRSLGAQTVTGSIAIRAGASRTFTVTYTVDDVVQRIEGVNALVVRLLPQPTVNGVAYQVRIELPDGSRIESASRELDRRGTAAVFSGTRAGELDLALRYR